MPLKLRAYPLLRRLSACQKIPYQYTRPSIAPQIATSMQRHSASLARGKPLISAEGPDGTGMCSLSALRETLMFIVESIAEDQLYTYTRNRWMHV